MKKNGLLLQDRVDHCEIPVHDFAVAGRGRYFIRFTVINSYGFSGGLKDWNFLE